MAMATYNVPVKIHRSEKPIPAIRLTTPLSILGLRGRSMIGVKLVIGWLDSSCYLSKLEGEHHGADTFLSSIRHQGRIAGFKS